jgi:hypothetical protein
MMGRLKEGRAELHTTVDAELLRQIKILAAEQGNVKYGKLIEEGLRLVLKKYGKLSDLREG